LSADEIARRREAFRQALACERIEGIAHDPATDPIFEAWIIGEIDSEEALARIKAYLGVPTSRRSGRDGPNTGRMVVASHPRRDLS
jgi:hypothetical protein